MPGAAKAGTKKEGASKWLKKNVGVYGNLLDL
jgi:hypothetical protein